MSLQPVTSSALFHAAKVDKSPRLQRLVEYLRKSGRQGATSWELMQACSLVAVSTCISELRWQGYLIETTHEGTHEGRKVYRYRLI